MGVVQSQSFEGMEVATRTTKKANPENLYIRNQCQEQEGVFLVTIYTNTVLEDISSQDMAVSRRLCLRGYTTRGSAARKDPHSRHA